MPRVCSKCRQSKPISSFPKSKRGKDGLYAYCRDCNRECSQQFRDQHGASEVTVYHVPRSFNPRQSVQWLEREEWDT